MAKFVSTWGDIDMIVFNREQMIWDKITTVRHSYTSKHDDICSLLFLIDVPYIFNGEPVGLIFRDGNKGYTKLCSVSSHRLEEY